VVAWHDLANTGRLFAHAKLRDLASELCQAPTTICAALERAFSRFLEAYAVFGGHRYYGWRVVARQYD
jgi:hypothetical protein